ncbi:hypothetical protein ACN47E_001969 [Coniothyrium glycines]
MSAQLRRRLHIVLEDLPNNLPTFNEEQLLDDLCSLLQSPLYQYTIAPRLRHDKNSSTYGLLTPQSLESDLHGDNNKVMGKHMYIRGLDMRIKWDGASWATQLLHEDCVLVEGRQYSTSQEAGFTQSFHFFCEEAQVLSFEFRAREHAAAVRMGKAIDTVEKISDGQMERERMCTRGNCNGKKMRRIVKLKVRLAGSRA